MKIKITPTHSGGDELDSATEKAIEALEKLDGVRSVKRDPGDAWPWLHVDRDQGLGVQGFDDALAPLRIRYEVIER